MEKRVSFIFYRSFYDAITLLEPEERLEAMMPSANTAWTARSPR